jgi:hypothetical protein
MDMSIPSTNKKDSHHVLLGSLFSLITVMKTDVLMVSKLKAFGRAYGERYIAQVYVTGCKKTVNTAIEI